MAASAWLVVHGVDAAGAARVAGLVEAAGIRVEGQPDASGRAGIVVMAACDDAGVEVLRATSRHGPVLAIALGAVAWDSCAKWRALDAGATDLLHWRTLPADADDVACRLRRWSEVQSLMACESVQRSVAGQSPAWRGFLRGVVEVAHYTQASVLVRGETGTGKEQVARLIHELDARSPRGDFVVVDCTTLSPELSGSELFGHERGAYTGAAGAREGAFALADGGTLFLDEIGELSPVLQAQLLRVVQERQYKRVGSNSWQTSEFRLVCATHRDLEAAVAAGGFRADLYHRIAGWTCTAPTLRERREDILPLARFFLAQLGAHDEAVLSDDAVREYLLTRPYPGNARDLRQVVTRLWMRHSGGGPLTVGDIPAAERPRGTELRIAWPDAGFEGALRQAIEMGIGLKEIGQRTSDLAVQMALDREDGNLQRAAARLGVTDRALQIRQASRRAAA
jgi:transcriptional regulator with GAF, ATPase, and Fis domain